MSRWGGSNLRPFPYEGTALPTELHRHDYIIYLERDTGIEPVFSAWEADILPLY